MSERLRLLHPITRLIVGGAQENTLFTALRLDPQRFEVDVVSGPQTGSEGSLIEEARRDGVRLTILPTLVRQISPINDLRALLSLRRIIRQGGYAIVHTHSSKAGLLGRIAARLAGTPMIIHTVHGWSFHAYMHPLVRRLYILLERWTASFSAALIVVSGGDRRKGLQAGIGRPEQYRTIRSAIPLEQFDPRRYDRAAVREELGFPPEAIVFGNVGRFSAQKNPLDWARLAGLIAAECPQARFLLVGGGPLQAQVETELAAQGIAHRTLMPGLQRDVGRWLSAMDVFVLTSLWEGLPRVLPQAMAMRLPVIANRADGTAEAVRDGLTGFLVEPGDLPAAQRRALELARNPLLRLEMGRRARQIALQEFDLNVMIAQIEALYEELLGQKQLGGPSTRIFKE